MASFFCASCRICHMHGSIVCVRVYICIHAPTCIHTHANQFVHAYTHIHNIHTYIHTCTSDALPTNPCSKDTQLVDILKDINW